MKTTVDLPEELLLEAKQVALKRRTTLKHLLTEGLRLSIQSEMDHSLPLDTIADVGKGKWDGVDADQYMADIREGWE